MTKIQWTDKTDNPIKRVDGGNYCEKISPGCANCYASALNSRGTRFGGNGLAFGGVRPPECRPKMGLNAAMVRKWARMRKPKKHFIGSMTDVFGDWVTDRQIFDLLDAMGEAQSQTFQLLTKRPDRAANVTRLYYAINNMPVHKNVWIGVSMENQQCLDDRLPGLIRTKAATRFLSLEPLLGPIVLPDWPDLDHIDWVIIGGESGPNARPLNINWIRDILEQCRAANIAAFVKQMGSSWAKEVGAKHSKGGDPDEWPKEFKVRMFPGDKW